MAGYADEAAIRRFLGRYSDGWPPAGAKPPTVADGLALGDAASGELDAILNSRGIATPVAAPALFLNRLRDAAAQYAASFIAAQLFPQAAGPASTTLHEWLMRQYRAFLEGLRRGDTIPSDMTATTAGRLGRSYQVSHPTEDDGRDNTEPIFKSKTEQW